MHSLCLFEVCLIFLPFSVFLFFLNLCSIYFILFSLICANSVVSLSVWMKNKPELGFYGSIISQGLLTKKISLLQAIPTVSANLENAIWFHFSYIHRIIAIPLGHYFS